ncbi:thiolase-like protein [Aspergillus tetrazonus]
MAGTDRSTPIAIIAMSGWFPGDASNAQKLCSDGRCKAFDEQADGYARGEGTGFVLLKPLNAALADGNAIRAFIRGTGLNQDGHTPGITVSSAEEQERLIRSVYDQACLDPVETPFVEAHGTGTRKGDLAAVSSLARVSSHRRLPQDPLYIGSVKTNIGHLRVAAGVSQISRQFWPWRTSLSLRFIYGAGFLAQSSVRVADSVSKFNFLRIQQSVFLWLVELAVTSPDHLPAQAQIIMGRGTGETIASHDRDACDAYWLRDPPFNVLGQVGLHQLQTINSEPTAQGFSLGASLAAAETVAAPSAAVLDALCRKLATVSSTEAGNIDTSRPLSSYVVDSLLAVNLRAYLATEARLDISVFELMRSRPVRELARDFALRPARVP